MSKSHILIISAIPGVVLLILIIHGVPVSVHDTSVKGEMFFKSGKKTASIPLQGQTIYIVPVEDWKKTRNDLRQLRDALGREVVDKQRREITAARAERAELESRLAGNARATADLKAKWATLNDEIQAIVMEIRGQEQQIKEETLAMHQEIKRLSAIKAEFHAFNEAFNGGRDTFLIKELFSPPAVVRSNRRSIYEGTYLKNIAAGEWRIRKAEERATVLSRRRNAAQRVFDSKGAERGQVWMNLETMESEADDLKKSIRRADSDELLGRAARKERLWTAEQTILRKMQSALSSLADSNQSILVIKSDSKGEFSFDAPWYRAVVLSAYWEEKEKIVRYWEAPYRKNSRKIVLDNENFLTDFMVSSYPGLNLDIEGIETE